MKSIYKGIFSFLFICFFAASVLSAENRKEINGRIQLSEQSFEAEGGGDFAFFLAKTKQNVSMMHIQPNYTWMMDASEQKKLSLTPAFAIEGSRSFFRSLTSQKEQLSDMEKIASFLGGALVLFDVVNCFHNKNSLFGGHFFHRERINPYDTGNRNYSYP